MSESKKMSRRDWFRLRIPKPKQEPKREPSQESTRQAPMGQTAPGLQPIEHPVNHDMMDLSQLPPMREALLTREDVNDLFADISLLGTDILLMQRSARASRTAQATASRATSKEQLTSAREALLSGTIARIQIRYRWENASWIDTLETRQDGFRLVRISHEAI